MFTSPINMTEAANLPEGLTRHEETDLNKLSPSSPSHPPTTPTSDPQRLFAPLNIPFHRRVETACVFFLFCLPILFLVLNLYCLFFSPWYLRYPYLACLAYSVLLLTAHQRGTSPLRSAYVRSGRLFAYFRDYFPITLYPPTAPLTPTRSYILGYHPHGIISVGAITAFASNACRWDAVMGRDGQLVSHLVTLDAQFRLPFWNLLLLCCGVVDSSRACIDRLLSRPGNVVVIVLGGASESLDAYVPAALPHPEQFISATPPATPSASADSIAPPPVLRSLSAPSPTSPAAAHRLTAVPSPSASSAQPLYPILLHLNHRKGFIYLALLHGSTLLPTFAFGELSLFSQLPNPRGSALRRFQDRLQHIIGFATPLFQGRGILNYRYGILPQRHRVDVRVGEPIEVQRAVGGSAAVTRAMVDEVHERYKKGLVELFEKWKGEYEETRHAVLVFVD